VLHGVTGDASVDEQPEPRPPIASDPAGRADHREDEGPASGMPRWVLGFVAVGALLVLMVIIMLLAGHDPGRHLHASALAPTGPANARVLGMCWPC
jgi:hypothetical protein